jgi:hypothetical protein
LELERCAQSPCEAAVLVDGIEEALGQLDLTYRHVLSLGAAERAAAFEAVNGNWEAVQRN